MNNCRVLLSLTFKGYLNYVLSPGLCFVLLPEIVVLPTTAGFVLGKTAVVNRVTPTLVVPTF